MLSLFIYSATETLQLLDKLFKVERGKENVLNFIFHEKC
jgi:hypothetical protein